MTPKRNPLFFPVGALLVATLLLATQEAFAVVAPSTWTTAIQVQGETLGTEFDDWTAAGIPVATTDSADNVGFIDFNTVQIANDNDFVYIRVSYHDNNSVGTYLGFDLDQNTATGFDIFGLGLVGSELGYSNDFSFEQGTGVFNTGDSLTGGPLGTGGALIFPFFGTNGPEKEYAIPLDAGFTNPVADAFSSTSFDLLVWSDQGAGDVTERISYTLATAPFLAGDYDGSGTVDAADYTVYRDTFGNLGAGLAADGNGNNEIDLGDHDFWVANYGTSSASAATVPEPATLLTLLVSVAAWVARRPVV